MSGIDFAHHLFGFVNMHNKVIEKRKESSC